MCFMQLLLENKMHGAYGINKLNEEAVRHHQATKQLSQEHAAKVAEAAAKRNIGACSGDVSNGTNSQPA
jgi:hypothetical protein